MSYISDFLASDGSEEAYQEYKQAAARENRVERETIRDWERNAYENVDLVIDNDDEYPMGYNPYQE